MDKYFPERVMSSFFLAQLLDLIIKALEITLTSFEHLIAWPASIFHLVNICKILRTHAIFIFDLVIFLLIHLLELDLFINMLFCRELYNTWLRAKHNKNEKDRDDHKGKVDTILCIQWITEKWKFWWILLCVLSKLKDSCDHNTNDTLLSSVLVLAPWNQFFFTIDCDLHYSTIVLNIRSTKELHENHNVHPSKQEKQEQESSNYFSEELEVLSMVYHVGTFHCDTKWHVQNTKNNRKFHFDRVRESKHVSLCNTPCYV